MSLRLDTPVKFLKGIGERRAEAFAKLGVHTAGDLLWHIPFRYLDASTITPLAKARVGDEVACIGRVVAKRLLPTRRGLRIFHAVLKDESGLLECAWPGQAFLDRLVDPNPFPAWLTEADLEYYASQFRNSGFRGPLNRYRNSERDFEQLAAYDGKPFPHPTAFWPAASSRCCAWYPASIWSN